MRRTHEARLLEPLLRKLVQINAIVKPMTEREKKRLGRRWTSPEGARDRSSRNLGLIPSSTAISTMRHVLHACTGRVIVSGMGKSGIISHKIAATLSSTGTSAFFLHPAEAIHGDLGAVRAEDVVLALSNTGETEELIRLVEAIRRIGAKLIALTGNPQSTLGLAADIALSCHVAAEACPLNLAPTRVRRRLCRGATPLPWPLRTKGFRA